MVKRHNELINQNKSKEDKLTELYRELDHLTDINVNERVYEMEVHEKIKS